MNHSYILQKISKIDILKPMKISEIWQKFLNTRTANACSYLILIDINMLLFSFVFFIYLIWYNEEMINIIPFLRTMIFILVPIYVITKLICVILIYLYEKIFNNSQFNVETSSEKIFVKKTFFVILQIKILIFLSILYGIILVLLR